MLDVYPVYLKLGWKHSVSCVSETSQDQKHTLLAPTRSTRTYSTRTYSLHATRISRHQSQDGRLAQRLLLLIPFSLVSRVLRVLVALPALDVRAPTRTLHAQLHMYTSLGRREIILVLLPQYTLYLCIWLCIWCVSASKTETHRYTRIRTPHPVYLTSRAVMHAIEPAQ